MGVIKDWKKRRAERIAAAEARGTGTSNVPMSDADKSAAMRSLGLPDMTAKKVDPRAQKFLDMMAEELKDHGLTSKQVIDQCCFDLHEIAIKGFRRALRTGGVAEDAMLQKMAAALTKAGITAEVEQEEIILKYFMFLKDLGMQ